MDQFISSSFFTILLCTGPRLNMPKCFMKGFLAVKSRVFRNSSYNMRSKDISLKLHFLQIKPTSKYFLFWKWFFFLSRAYVGIFKLLHFPGTEYFIIIFIFNLKRIDFIQILSCQNSIRLLPWKLLITPNISLKTWVFERISSLVISSFDL